MTILGAAMLVGRSAFRRALVGLIAGIPFLIAASGASANAEVQRMIVEEALKSRVPPALALAVARVESNFEPRAESPVGARGVMQIMPKTARGVFGVHESQLWNAKLNIRLGITFLEQLYDQYGQRWDLALSHYNGGTLNGGSGAGAVPHRYTLKYIADVQRWQRHYENPNTFRADAARVRSQIPVVHRPARDAQKSTRIDPLEFEDWANIERRRLERRRELDDFARRR